ncbi:MAG: Crp/Fnr family transcriptional regulator [Clostridiales bacterium]|jgi:CRP/FNR family transcriptional regulator|nr:Crp/Fnr family transcriptional regulator [Clostridiales bacterium]
METIELENLFPNWSSLTAEQQQLLFNSCKDKKYKKGQLLHGGLESCLGLLLVKSGVLRAYIISETGKEITLYRLFPKDMCLFSASCVMKNISFEMHIEASKDSEVCIIPTDTYQKLADNSIVIANYINELMATRFSDVMWILEQTLFTRFDSRLASFLIEETGIENSKTLTITHEEIAKHIGSAREVVSKMLKYFTHEGIVELSRGKIHITDMQKLYGLVQ